MTNDPPNHLLHTAGAMRPQLRLVAANGHDRWPGRLRPAVVPLPEPYLDVDLTRLERQAARESARKAAADARRAAEALDNALAARAERHLRERGTLRNLKPAARFFVVFYFGACALLCVLALWHIAAKFWPAGA